MKKESKYFVYEGKLHNLRHFGKGSHL